jgi:hypothetical protein
MPRDSGDHWPDDEEIRAVNDDESVTIIPNDELDGLCDPDIQPEPIPDEDLDGIVLFADIAGQDLEAIDKRKKEWEEVFRAS